jgi:adenylate cyclase class 2
MAMPKKFEEIECKFLDVDTKDITKKLEKLGAKKKFSRTFRRYVFDFPDLRLNSMNAWLRVRDEGHKTTVTYKQRLGVIDDKNDDGMREVEIVVDSFDHAVELLRSIGMKPKFYEENKRTAYELDGVEIDIDEWPLIPPYVEVEGKNWQEVDAMSQRLGFNPKDKLVCATMQVYARYGITENDYKILTFDTQVKKDAGK